MNFNEEKHEYTRNGNTYTSVTTLIKKYGLSTDYTGISAATLQQAAQRGNAIHKALELYIDGDQSMIGFLPEVDLVNNYIITRGINLATAKSEEIVYDDHYKIAGTIDFQYVDGEDNIIADFKTTSQLHADPVAWQLSIYNYLKTKGDIMQYYFNKLKVFHLVAGKLYVRDVYTVDYDAVKALLETNLQNLPTFTYVKNTGIVSNADELLITQILTELEPYEAVVSKLTKELDEVLDRVKTNMLDKKDFRFDNPSYTITYSNPQHRKSLDTKRVVEYLKQQGENINDYYKETITKDGIKIKRKGSLLVADDEDPI